MKIRMILENQGGELGQHQFETDDPSDVSDQLVELLDTEWIVAPGDTIRIVDVTP